MNDKMINIGASFDSSGIKTGTAEAAKAIQDAGGKLSQVTEDIQTKTAPAFKNLQQAYRQTAKDAQVLAMTQGTSSAAFIEAAQRAADLKDQLDDVNDVVQAFHPEQRFKVAGDAISGVSGALQGLYGGMELLGVNTENAQKVMTTLMSLQGLAGMGAAIEQASGAFKAMSVIINTTVIPSLMTLQGALIATGIGAVIIAVIALTQAASAYNDELDRQIGLQKNIEEQRKLDIKALNDVKDKNFQTRKLMVQAMKEGVDKEIELAKLRRDALFIEQQKELDASNKTYYDYQRLNERKKYIEQIFQNELAQIKKNASKSNEDIIKANSERELMALETAQFKYEQAMKMRLNSKIGPKQSMETGSLFGNVLKGLPEQLKAGQIAIENFVNQTGDKTSQWAVETANALQDFNKAILSTATNAFGQLGTIIGQSLAGADISIGQFFASIADQIGSAMIAIGSAMVGAALAGATAVAPMAYAYLGGGFALKSVAGYLGTKSGGNSTPKTSGSYSGTGSVMGGNFSPNNMNVEINSRLLGNDLLLSVQKSNQKQTRVK